LQKLGWLVKKIFEQFKAITLRDGLLVIGLGLFWFGLFQFLPWVSFTVTGAIIFTLAFLFGEK
jgi:hypothetical protein